MSRSTVAPWLAAGLALTTACTAAADDAGWRTIEVGECAPPPGSSALPLASVELHDNHCLSPLTGDLAVVGSVAEWDQLFDCETPVPDGLDLAAGRAAVVQADCQPVSARFVAETPAELVVGVYQRVTGACIEPPLVVALPSSTKPVRLARCQESCEGDCPIIP